MLLHRSSLVATFLAAVAVLPTASWVLALSGPSVGNAIRRQPIGRITSLDRSKLDTAVDTNFYRQANLVTHTDDAFIERLQQVYKEYIPNTGKPAVVLDIMSSHVSHLPSELSLERLDVHGMNVKELEQNTARTATDGATWVRDLNDNPSFIGLCDTNEVYDAVLCCVGVQYLEEPEAVFAEVARLLKPGTGTVIVSFTNRFFYQKALQGWLNRGMKERARLVQDYLRAAGGFEDIQIQGDGTSVWKQLQSVGGLSGDPFVAVVARRSAE
jgi:SAM-dependent methyltransferase